MTPLTAAPTTSRLVATSSARWSLVAAWSALLATATLSAFVGGPPGVATASTTHSGTVDVLYAGSFLDLMQQQLDPAFRRATGYTVSGISAGSSALASEIVGGTEVGDVFISASPTMDQTLQRPVNGHWVTTYDEFAQSPLVLGYNPGSKFADALRTRPWYDVVDRKGFLLGRTDPATDPKGALAVDALTGVARRFDLPALAKLATSPSNVFEETALVGEVQAAQLDAGFFYAVEASAAHLKTVALVGTHLAGTYTIAILKNAPHKAAAQAFVKFLLSATGAEILRTHGVTPIRPVKVVSDSSSSTPP